jgi:hypothetical protein
MYITRHQSAPTLPTGYIQVVFNCHNIFSRKDFDASASKTEYEDSYQIDKSTGNRGHQYAGVFLQRASGLDKVIKEY